MAGLAVAVAGAFPARRRRIRGGLAIFPGLWLAAPAFLVPLYVPGGLETNDVLVGLALVIVGFTPYDRPGRRAT